MKQNKVDFKQKLASGQHIEYAVADHLQQLLPDCKVINTPQDNDIDRFIYSLVDVVVVRNDHILLGIECKYGREKLMNCLKRNGWDGDYNTVINASSLHKYKQATFPVYVMNFNSFCQKVLVADLPTVLNSPNDGGKNIKSSGEVRYNIDSRNWMIYSGDIHLKDILVDILKKEKLC